MSEYFHTDYVNVLMDLVLKGNKRLTSPDWLVQLLVSFDVRTDNRYYIMRFIITTLPVWSLAGDREWMWVWGEENYWDSVTLSDLFIVMNTDGDCDSKSFCLESGVHPTHTGSFSKHARTVCPLTPVTCVRTGIKFVHLLFNLQHVSWSHVTHTTKEALGPSEPCRAPLEVSELFLAFPSFLYPSLSPCICFDPQGSLARLNVCLLTKGDG